MADEQKTTTANKQRLLEKLEPQHQEAVLMCYGGFTYQRIARELKVTYGTVRQWFMTGGLCKPAYDELIKELGKENHKKAKKMHELLEDVAPEMFEALRKSAAAGNWLAAQSLLDRAGYSPLSKAQITVDPAVKDRVMEILKGGRKQDDNSTTDNGNDQATQ